MKLEEAVKLAKDKLDNELISTLDEKALDNIKKRIDKIILEKNYHVEV